MLQAPHLAGIFLRHDHARIALLSCRDRHRQHAANPAQFTAERKLADKHCVLQPAHSDLRRRSKDRNGNRKVVYRTLLFEIRRSEIYGDMQRRKFQSAVTERALYTLPGFPNGSVGEADGVKGRQSAGNVRFHTDRAALYPAKRIADHF